MRREQLILQGQQTRAAIVRAAAEQIASAGYAGSSLSDIAARLGKPKTALRHHFGTKSEVAIAVAAFQNDSWTRMRDAAADRDAPGLRTLLALLSSAIEDSHAEPYASAVIMMRVTQRETGVDLPDVPFSWFEIVRFHLSRAQAQGDLPADLDTERSARLVLDSTFGIHQRHVSGATRATLDTDYATLWRYLLLGVGVVDPDRIIGDIQPLEW
jgi:AcrR family transcriptional regulator